MRAVPFLAGQVGQVRFVAEKAVDDQHACVIDPFLDRLITAKGPLVVREGKFLRNRRFYRGVKHKQLILSENAVN